MIDCTSIQVLTPFAGLVEVESWSVRKLGYYPQYNNNDNTKGQSSAWSYGHKTVKHHESFSGAKKPQGVPLLFSEEEKSKLTNIRGYPHITYTRISDSPSRIFDRTD